MGELRFHLFRQDCAGCAGTEYSGSFYTLDDALASARDEEMTSAELWENAPDGHLVETYNLKRDFPDRWSEDMIWKGNWEKVVFSGE